MALALVLAAAATPILSCPGGTIEIPCTAAEVTAKIALTRSRVGSIAQRCLYDFGGQCTVAASGRINTADRGPALLRQKILPAPRDGARTRSPDRQSVAGGKSVSVNLVSGDGPTL